MEILDLTEADAEIIRQAFMTIIVKAEVIEVKDWLDDSVQTIKKDK